MKKIIFTAILLASVGMNAQDGKVGVGNTSPKATLDVTGTPATATVADGIIAPRLTGNQLAAKNAVYLADQTGTQVYVTAAASAPAGKTVNVTAPGYYYFDGTVWQKIANGKTKFVDGTDPLNAVYTSGNVGIGTTTPSATLDVVSDGNSSTTNGFTLTNFDDRLTFKIADNGDITGSGMTLNKKTYSGLNEETYLNIQSPIEHSVIQMRSIASKSSQFRFFTATFDANGNPLTENREFTIRSERNPAINTSASLGDLMLDLNGDNSLHVNDNTNTTLMVVKQNGQTGIGNSAPNATLDVQGKPANATIADGIIAPLLTGDQLAAKNAVYDATKTGAIVYVTAAATTPSGKTEEVTGAGYYYFDGTKWQGVSYENIYNKNGTLTGNRVVTQGSRTLAFTASAVNAFSVDGTTFSVDASNDRVGIGTATPNAPLSVGSARQVNLGLSGGTTASGNYIGFNTISSSGNNFSTTTATSFGLNNTFTIWNNNQNGEVLFTPYTVADPAVSENFNPRTEAAIVIKHDTKNVGIGTNTPAAKLEVNGMIKIGTSTATPVAGMIKYETGHFYGYTGSAWVQLDN